MTFRCGKMLTVYTYIYIFRVSDKCHIRIAGFEVGLRHDINIISRAALVPLYLSKMFIPEG